MFRPTRRLLGAISSASALTACALLVAPASSQADLVKTTACDNSSVTQPFLPWADPNYYKLAPGGSFEGSLSGWSLKGGATRTRGSESFGVTGSVGKYSLLLPSGSTATSPQTCVNAAYPSFRLFTRTSNPGAMVTVSVIYGKMLIPVGVITPGTSWEPSLPMLTGSAIAGALNGGTAWLSIRFTASGGSAQIDDVYVDPWGRRG